MPKLCLFRQVWVTHFRLGIEAADICDKVIVRVDII